MPDELFEEPRAWNDNHPWVGYGCMSTDDDGDLRVNGQKIEIRWVFQSSNFLEPIDSLSYFRGLAYDRLGNFYAVSEQGDGALPCDQKAAVKKITGKAALTWFAKTASWDADFSRELCRAIDNPDFQPMSLVSTRAAAAKSRRGKGKNKNRDVFHGQLLMATALVECVRKLEAAPTIANLADACRSVSTLHKAIHEPENFKLAAQG